MGTKSGASTPRTTIDTIQTTVALTTKAPTEITISGYIKAKEIKVKLPEITAGISK